MGYAAKLGGKGSSGSLEPNTGYIADIGDYNTVRDYDTGLDDVKFLWMYSDSQTTLCTNFYYPASCNNRSDNYTAVTPNNNASYTSPIGSDIATHLPCLRAINGGVITLRGASWHASTGGFTWYAWNW